MKKISIIVVIVILSVIGLWYQYVQRQTVVPQTPKINGVTGGLSSHTPINAQNVAFSELRPGINNFNGLILELFDIKSMKKDKSETFYVEGREDCSSGCSTITDYYFSYFDRNFKLTEDEWESGGTAGRTVVYELFMQNKETGKWDNIGSVDGKWGIRAVGYKNNLILSSSYYNYHTKGESIGVYDITERKLVSAKSLSSNFVGNFWAERILEDRMPTLYQKEGKLYVRTPRDRCYFLSDHPTYVCGDACNLEESLPYFNDRPRYIYAGCVSGYYPAEATSTLMVQDLFKDEYANEAAKYDLVLKTTNWASPSAQDTLLMDFQYTASSSMEYNNEGIYSHPAEWLSPLLGRALNMSLAGEDVLAWNMFRVDFDALSKRYPLMDPVDPVLVEHDLRNELSSQ